MEPRVDRTLEKIAKYFFVLALLAILKYYYKENSDSGFKLVLY